MSNEVANCLPKYQQLLRDLKCTVEGLLVGQVANVFIYGGLNRLHIAVEKIFKHGCKGTSEDKNCSNYWQFIVGLEWLQPSSTRSSFTLDCEYNSHIPQHLKLDKASVWLYRSLENHSLSQKLSWLLTDKTHLKACYQSYAFLRQEKYVESVLICLRAVERSQPSLMSEIDPCLFLNKSNVKDYHKMHRRCSSFPDNHLKNIENPSCIRSKTMHKLDLSCREIKSMESCTPQKRIIQGKLKSWSSMPSLPVHAVAIRKRSKSATPSTPVVDKPKNNQSSSSLLPAKNSASVCLQNKQKKVKHVIINNSDIIEHTPPLSNSYNKSSSALSEDLANESVKSLPETKSTSFRKMNLARSAPDYGFLTALSGEKDYKKQPKKSFIEDGGLSVLPMATGYFPRPTKGQTLTSFLTSSQFARANAELDRENAHFSISEAMISAIEQIKCKRDLKLADEQVEESDEEIMDLKQRIRLRRRQKLEERQRKVLGSSLLSDGKTDTTTTEASTSPYSTSPGTPSESLSSDEVEDIEIDEASNLIDNRGMSMSMASLYSDADLFKKPRGAPDGASNILSAEGVALSLISRFNEKQLPRASDLEWLVSEEDAPQALLPLPKSWPVNSDDADEMGVTSLRGTNEWAPPRPQIIFTPHPRPDTFAWCCGCSDRRKKLMAKQNYRCAGCGMRVASQYASRFRYCEYLGRYFCTGCHTNQLAPIPGRVLQRWDFTRYPVSTFSYRLLEQMYTDPLFRILELNKNITKRSKNLEVCRKYRLGLYYLKDFILTCRFAETIRECLENESSYVLSDPDVYSMQDLVNVRSGEMKSRLKYLVEMCCRHTSECELCLARGFICEICASNDIIFPWQLRKVARCYKCGSCFHIQCWNPKEAPCAKCRRISLRKEDSSSTSRS